MRSEDPTNKEIRRATKPPTLKRLIGVGLEEATEVEVLEVISMESTEDVVSIGGEVHQEGSSVAIPEDEVSIGVEELHIVALEVDIIIPEKNNITNLHKRKSVTDQSH